MTDEEYFLTEIYDDLMPTLKVMMDSFKGAQRADWISFLVKQRKQHNQEASCPSSATSATTNRSPLLTGVYEKDRSRTSFHYKL